MYSNLTAYLIPLTLNEVYGKVTAMARKDWVSANIPVGLAERLDEFLKTQDSYKMGYTSRNQIIVDMIKEFLSKYEKGEKRKSKS